MRRLHSLLFIAGSTAAASCISLVGGIGLESVTEQLLPLVPLMIAMPALNTMAGDYAAIIAAHATDPAERASTKKQVARAIAKAIWVNIIGVLVLSSAIAWQRGYLFSDDFLARFILFIVASMIGTAVFMMVLTAILDKLLERHHLNPDDLLIPIVTSITDVIMLSLVAMAAVLLF